MIYIANGKKVVRDKRVRKICWKIYQSLLVLCNSIGYNFNYVYIKYMLLIRSNTIRLVVIRYYQSRNRKKGQNKR